MKLGKTIIFGIIATVLGTTALAESDADNAILYRKAVMGSVGAHMNAIAMIMQGKVEQKEAFAAHARGLALSASTALAAFKQNTADDGFEQTTVKDDTIWVDWPGFEKRMGALVDASSAMAAAADAGTSNFDDLKALGAACKACHDNFRKRN